ncbi:MAG: hypothetical protein M0P70_08545 [Desulfobulbaceae bacterium]|nr:hypothetical protein [Desulfobulbaceae bacterium]
MISEEIKKSMMALVERGAALTLKDKGLSFAASVVVWVNDAFFCWCQRFPEDQHHFHV